MSKKVIYEFPGFKGQNGRIQAGYAVIAIKNGEAEIDESNLAVRELARQNGGSQKRAAAKPGGKK